MPKRPLVPEGRDWDVHRFPLFELVKTSPEGVPSPRVKPPTMKQRVEEGQEMPSDMSVPGGACGSDVRAQDFPPFVVVMTDAPRRGPPTTTQLFTERQETRARLPSALGNDRCVHTLPEFVVTKATPLLPSGVSPTATQNAFVGHETPVSRPTPAGMTDLAQVSPRSVVLTAFPRTSFASNVPPTATHEFAEGHEIAGGVSILVGSETLSQWTPPSDVVAAMPNMV